MISRNADRAQRRLGEQTWGRAESSTLSPSLPVSAHLLHLFIYLFWSQQTHLCSLFHTEEEGCPPTAPEATCCSSRHTGWLNPFHSLALCSNSKSLAKTDLVHFRLSLLAQLAVKFPSMAAVSLLLCVRWKLKEWLSAAQKLQKVSTIVVGVLRARWIWKRENNRARESKTLFLFFLQSRKKQYSKHFPPPHPAPEKLSNDPQEQLSKWVEKINRLIISFQHLENIRLGPC